MINNYNIYWGDTHHNTYQNYGQKPALEEVLSFAGAYLDFYTAAYYTAVDKNIPLKTGSYPSTNTSTEGHPNEIESFSEIRWSGVDLEEGKDVGRMQQEWLELQEITSAWNRPGEFVAFPGYEWQGDGRSGDHNVIYKQEGEPIYVPETITELYNCLRGKDALAIPHHTGYSVGYRAPDWSKCNESISPFAEVFSMHGCSETDEEWIGLRNNSYLGPGAHGGTYQAALDRGLHIGAICSSDNWTNMPGYWGQGLMACLARDLTRESLWEAFLSRHVYGVSGDRIELDFTCNDAIMGSILDFTPERNIHVGVRGTDAIDRIELLRNGRVISTHCHQGTWNFPADGVTSRYKLRIETGWGPALGSIPNQMKEWFGEISIPNGRIIGWEPCWICRGQEVAQVDHQTLQFQMKSIQRYVSRKSQGAIIVELEATPETILQIRLNGKEVCESVRSFEVGSRVLWYREESIQLLKEAINLRPEEIQRSEAIFYLYSHKAKLHRLVPEIGYTITFDFVDDEPFTTEINYRVRVEQRNGQRAWSSPIWIKGKK